VDDDLWPGPAGLIVLGVVVAVLVLGCFVWVFSSWYSERHSAPGRSRTTLIL
jgi:hypothetical protein